MPRPGPVRATLADTTLFGGAHFMRELGGGALGLHGGPVGDGWRGPAEVQVVEFSDCVGELIADDLAQHLAGSHQEGSVFSGEQMVEGGFGVFVVAAGASTSPIALRHERIAAQKLTHAVVGTT
jgi:hypothetical protein